MTALLWESEFTGTSGTAITSTSPITGTYGTPIDVLSNGGVLEVNGSGEGIPRGSGAVNVFIPLTGYTLTTGNKSYASDMRAGGTDAQNVVSIAAYAGASGNSFYIFGIANTGMFVDRYSAGVFSSNLFVSTTGITAGTNYLMRFDFYRNGQIAVWKDGVLVTTVVDGSPITPDGSPDYLVLNNAGPSATKPRMGSLKVYSDIIEATGAKNDNQGPRRALRRKTYDRLFNAR